MTDPPLLHSSTCLDVNMSKVKTYLQEGALLPPPAEIPIFFKYVCGWVPRMPTYQQPPVWTIPPCAGESSRALPARGGREVAHRFSNGLSWPVGTPQTSRSPFQKPAIVKLGCMTLQRGAFGSHGVGVAYIILPWKMNETGVYHRLHYVQIGFPARDEFCYPLLIAN